MNKDMNKVTTEASAEVVEIKTFKEGFAYACSEAKRLWKEEVSSRTPLQQACELVILRASRLQAGIKETDKQFNEYVYKAVFNVKGELRYDSRKTKILLRMQCARFLTTAFAKSKAHFTTPAELRTAVEKVVFKYATLQDVVRALKQPKLDEKQAEARKTREQKLAEEHQSSVNDALTEAGALEEDIKALSEKAKTYLRALCVKARGVEDDMLLRVLFVNTARPLFIEGGRSAVASALSEAKGEARESARKAAKKRTKKAA
jgi:hypothetical protein